jgi:Filamin/ABP280 repeat.
VYDFLNLIFLPLVQVDVKDNRDGTFALNYTPKECGKYTLDVAYDGIPVPGSPFEFEVSEGGPDKVKVYGKGIFA